MATKQKTVKVSKKTAGLEKKLDLIVTKRTVFGKKLLKLRHEGIVPGNIFGTDFKSEAVSVVKKDFINIYKTAKETGIIYLQLNSEEIPVLIKTVQTHPVTDLLLHVDFRKVNLKAKIVTEVPVTIIGVSVAVTQQGGVLLTQMNRLSVEALPQDIPQTIDVDISTITELGQEIKVSQIKLPVNCVVKDEADKVVVSVIAHKEESITPETTVAAPEVITEKAPAEGEEETAPDEGKSAAPAVEKKTEKKTDTKAK